MLEAKRAADPVHAFEDLVELNRYTQSTLVGIGFDGIAKLRGWIDALPPDSPLRSALPGLAVVLPGADAASVFNDIYLGDAANNTFNGGGGDDVIDGGAGNDLLVEYLLSPVQRAHSESLRER